MRYYILVICTVSLTIFSYFPGLLGGYLFDDLPNLRNIEIYSNFEGVDALIRYILSYDAGPLKRPVSTLSFLLNTTTLTVNAFSFKVFNLFIHLINGVLLYLVTYKIIALNTNKETFARNVALSTMAFWLLHPYFVSTTLYVIQRMAMLPTSFVLLGLFFYLKGRDEKYKNSKKSYFYIFLGLYVCTFLATLSKENGIILPFLILLIEFLVLNKNNSFNMNKLQRVIFILPLVVIVLGFAILFNNILSGYSERDFTLIERLMTESRILVYYLYNLFFPSYFTEGVFFDGVEISKSLINPITTIFSIIFILILIVSSVLIRKKYPLIAFSVLFYFVSHVLESSFIPLELAFEHRNYLPALFIFLPVAIFIYKKFNKYYLNHIAVISIIIILSSLTYKRTNMWSDTTELMLATQEKYPNSIRAIDEMVRYHYMNRNTNLAIELLEDSIKRHRDISLRVNLINLKCMDSSIKKEDFSQLNNYIRQNRVTKHDAASIYGLLEVLYNDDCSNIDITNESENLLNTLDNSNGIKINKVRNVVNKFKILFSLKKNEFEKAYSLSIKYLDDYAFFADVINFTNIYIEKNQHDYANLVILKLEEILKQFRFRYTDRDYINEVCLMKKKITGTL